ncbi:hypothetical protein A5725_20075 [Mycobacterium kubicae]|nr:hypothetical protein A5725_20075 [Mycobacterium kubicae]
METMVNDGADEHFDAFSCAVSDTFVPLAMSVDDRSTFRGSLRSASLGAVQLSEVNVGSNGVVVRRTDRLIRRNNPDYLKVGIQVAGRSTVHQDDRKSELGTGDLAIYDTSRPYELRFAEAYRLLVVMFPKQLLGLPSGRLGYLTARGVNGRHGLGASVAPFLLQVGRRVLRGDHSDNAQLAEAIVDLVGALFVDHFPPDAAHPDAARRAQLARVRAYIERNLGNPRMKVSDIAAANRMSIRYLQKLFEERGETVTDWIRTKRLQQCARDLADARYRHLPVSSVAANWGLVNAAHFSRIFKAAYGVAPTAYRARGHLPAPVRGAAKPHSDERKHECLSDPTWEVTRPAD